MISDQSVLFISDYSQWSASAFQFVQSIFPQSTCFNYERGEQVGDLFDSWEGDWIFSFKSELLLPPYFINKAKHGALNFHPSPPKYRGIGGYILALKNKDKAFGATCHYVDRFIDNGKIISTSYFDLTPGENILSLYHKTAFHCLKLLFEVVDNIRNGQQLPQSTENWEKRLFMFKDFKNELAILKTVELKSFVSHANYQEVTTI